MASKSGVLAGKAYVLLEAIDGTATTLRNVENKFLAWGSRIQSIGTRIFARGLTGMVPAALSTNVFKQFDDIMRRVEARTQGTSSEMKALRNQAIGLGKSSAFSAREIAGLQDVLAQRKFDRTQIEQMTPSIAMLGRAAGGGDAPAQDLLNAADLVSQAIMMYEMGAEDAAKVSDIFTAAANESNFALEDLIISMANAGPVAHQYGMSLEETLAIMMVMRDLSIDPSIAGTGLRNLFIKASDKKAVEDFNELMLDMVGSTIEFKDELGNLASPADILFSFDKLTKDLGTAERGHLLAELFGLRAITPATAVSANAKNFTDALGVLLVAAGETEAAYKKMEGGIGGVFRRLANTIEAAALAYGDLLEEPVIAFGNAIVNLNLKIVQWTQNNQHLVVGITSILAAMLPLASALFLIGAAFKLIGFTMAPFVAVVGLLNSIASIAISSVIGLAGAAYLVMQSLSLAAVAGFRMAASVLGIIMSVSNLAVSLLSQVIPAMTAFITATLSFIASAAPRFIAMVFSMTSALTILGFTMIRYVAAAIVAVTTRLAMQFAVMAAGGVVLVVQLTHAMFAYAVSLGTMVAHFLHFVLGVGGAIAVFVGNIVAQILLVTAQMTAAIGYSLIGTGVLAMTIIGDAILGIGGAIISFVTAGVPLFLAGISAMISGIGAAIGTVWTLIASLGILNIAFIATFTGVAIFLIVAAFYAVVQVINLVRATWEYTKVALANGWAEIGNVASAVMNFVVQRFMQLAGTMMSTMKGITTALMAGDTGLAMEIAIAGLKVAWLQLKDTAIDAWSYVVVYIKSTIRDLIMEFNKLRIAFLGWAKEQFNFTNSLLGNPIGIQIESIKLDNQLLAQQRFQTQDPAADRQRAQDIADAQNALTSLNIAAENKKRIAEAIRTAEMNNIPSINGVPVPAIKDLITASRTDGSMGGAKAIEGVQMNTMEGAKAAYENAQNRLEAIQNKELETLKNIDNKLGGVNQKLQGILEKPETEGV